MKALIYLTIVGMIGATGLTPAQAQQTLKMNGKIASQKVRTVNGEAVAPLADIAAALGMVVVKTATGYELVAPGGANQVEGRRGKIGDVLFDGKWRFSVLEMQKVESYTVQTKTAIDYGVTSPVTDWNDDVYRPKPGHTMYVLRCRVKNGQTTPQALWWAQADVNTAIADTDGGSHPPIITDIAAPAFQSAPILPGAKLDFNLVFCFPTNARPRDLIFTLRSISDKGSDVRVSLGPG